MTDPPLQERLIVTPLLERDAIGLCSIDVRLGNQFLVLKRESLCRSTWDASP